MSQDNQLHLEIRRLSFGYEQMVLHEVSLAAAVGSLTMIVGGSGSGKSTLLRLINRLVEPPLGAIWLNGVDIVTLPPQTLRRRVGMVFQRPFLFPGTVADNVRYGPRLQGEMLSDEAVKSLLAAVLLPAEVAQTAVETLSGGQIQRVAIARALANQPELLLLDEPTTALDPRAVLQVEETIAHLRQVRQLSVIWVTHDVAQVQRMSGTVILVQNGRVTAHGAAETLFAAQQGAFYSFVNGIGEKDQKEKVG